MNKFCGIGRLTADPEIRTTTDGLKIARFTLAINRMTAKGEQKADFLRCVAFGKKADIAERYFCKGKKIAISGRVQTGSYKDTDGKTVYTTDIMVEETEFVESKGAEQPAEQPAEPPADEGGFIRVTEDMDEELPFN